MNKVAHRPIYPWHVDWPGVYDVDSGGLQSTQVAHRIIREHIEDGCRCIRCTGTSSWLLPILAEYDDDIDRMVMLASSGLLTGAGAYATELAAYLSYASTLFTTWLPTIVCVDQEVGTHTYGADLVPDLRDQIDTDLGDHVPVYYYWGEELFRDEVAEEVRVGDVKCPKLFYIWDDETLSPVEKLHSLIATATYETETGSLPWLSPYLWANNLSAGLVALSSFQRVCEVGKTMYGWAGFHSYPSAYSDETGGYDSTVTGQIRTILRAGAEVWA